MDFSAAQVTSGIICAGLALASIMVVHAFRKNAKNTVKDEPTVQEPEIPESLLLDHQPIISPTIQLLIDELPTNTNRMAYRRRLPQYCYPSLVEYVEHIRLGLLNGTVRPERALPKIDEFIQRKIMELRAKGEM